MNENHEKDQFIDIGIDPIFTDIFGDEVPVRIPAKTKTYPVDGRPRLKINEFGCFEAG
ncbi:hypothetical protein [Desulfosarcina variabilis]|uniref:hypothetical protein n=1 Tax=Desulfosarcina variabilis TaxID=2300 RepID=UPI003AFA6E8A